MSKTVKRISMVICVLFFSVLLAYNTGYVYAEAPQDQNFDSVAAGSSSGAYRVGELNFTTDTGIINVRGWDALSYEFGYGRTINGFSGMAMSNDPDLNTSPTYFAFESAIERTFKLESLYALITDVGSSTKVDIKGYNGLFERVHVDGIDFTKPGTTEYGDVTYTNNVYNSTDGEYGGFLFFGDSWYDINRVVITDTDTNQPLYISLDSLDFSNLTDLSIVDAPDTTEGQNATFRVNLTKAYTHDITLDYSINPQSATADDFNTPALNGTITIPSNATYGEIVVPIKDDTDRELAEDFKVTISNPSVGGIVDGEATCTIKDNDSPPKVSLSIDKSSIGENGGSAKITATLSNKTYENVTVNLDFSGAVAGTDFNAPASISIPANSLSNSVNITSLDDDIYSDGDKNVTVDISSVDKGDKGTFIPPKLTITDDETEPKVNLSITPGSISENGIDVAMVKATLTNKSSKDVTVKLAFSGAVKDKDFTVLSDTITIPSKQTVGSVQIKGIPNNKFNNNKVLTTSISDADVTNGSTGDIKSVPLTITNIDPKPKVTIEPVEFNENDSATKKAAFIVSLSQASDEYITVDYTTSDGSAKSPKDYTSASGTLTIAKGETSGTIEIDVLNDTLDEYDENFSLTINNPVGAELGTSSSVKCTIKDDDAAPDIVISNAAVDEVDLGNNTKLIFDVKLSAESEKTVTVNYSTADGTATQGLDYTATNGTLIFSPGETGPQQIQVTVLGDDLLEPSETVSLNLTATNANKPDYTATGTIKDNDKATISINDASVTEGPAKNIVFKISLSKPSSQSVTVKFRTKDGSAVLGEDYVQQEGTVTFAKGDFGDKTVTIGVNDDEIYEGVEAFYVELYDLSDSTIEMGKATGTGTINDDESKPLISVENITVNEGNSGKTTASFEISLSTASANDIYVNYATLEGTAKDGNDFTAATGNLKIPAGKKSGMINVEVAGDTVYEDNETFSLMLSNPSAGAEINPLKGTAVCTINDNDSAPSVTFEQNKVKVAEGDSGITQMVFNVTLSAGCEKTVYVNFATEDGTATIADNDYTPLSGKLEFAPGQTSKSIIVNISGDKTGEPDESYFVTLKLDTGDIKAEGIIQDDDKAFIKMFKKKDGSEISNGNTVNFEDTKTGKESELEFTISNTGNSDLTEDGINKLISVAGSDFTIKKEVVSPIVGKSSTTFIIVFKPSSTGTKTAEITITGKDAANSPFKFKITGTGTKEGTSGGSTTTPETPLRETIDINVGDRSLKNISVDVHKENNTKTTTVNLDETEVQKTLSEIKKTEPEKEKKVIVPIINNSDRVIGELKASTLQAMAEMDAILEIRTENAVYTLPANNINIGEIVTKLGGKPELKDILVKVTITKASDDKLDRIKASAANKGFEVKGNPAEFEISFVNAGREVTVSSFNNYVARTVAIPDGIDPKKITTGVVYNADGLFSHVPTAVNIMGNRYYAKINSLTNSTYALIYNPLSFKDVEEHWSKDYVNDAGSRLIVSGTGNGNFTPDKAITRAEFAVMIVKALGLKGSQFANNFTDVGKDNPYYSFICTAYQYGIITGYTNGKFGPNDLITREQSMTMISKAMKIAGMDTSSTNADNLNNKFSDSGVISKWARNGAAICVNSGLFVGNKGKLSPKNNVTRAESATVLIKLLKNAHLI
ncbi:Calx-beta domain-containing protein [Ruminiclostridium cellulolyticum]|uniref:Na-Ca exchanger/integrin-beta4 n=1 Tax=Ruminiclostridium cellulolyticum (strain ATCC 35319 / DSM 5812 / JCM 6584 / H10) TaxID=394503 RepID=B8I652_RUMCH|nr:Calx-beta domain-containing protein [Ruminiclostridium cellulolyticum]ACL76817.1 Na-Ca exchanger/integrin-beta4 [Ruminiclostridium cellulolyticum H10]